MTFFYVLAAGVSVSPIYTESTDSAVGSFTEVLSKDDPRAVQVSGA